MPSQTYDRSTQDVGNIVALEHVNVTIPDQIVATNFYVVGLGFTRDPYLMVGSENMWVNVGQQQFHLPTARPQVVQGHVGLVVPDLDALVTRLEEVRPRLAGTAFAFSVEDKHVAVSCPWGNRLRCHGPDPEYGELTLGLVHVEVPVAPSSAEGIARFYREIMGAPATVVPEHGLSMARVQVGHRQELRFRETAGSPRPYDGHHVAVYIADFSGPHRRLAGRGLVSEESNPVQYRFKDIVDPDSGRVLATLEHEVRSITHPMYLRPLVNRNPAQRQPTYQRGRDAFVPGMV